MSLQVLRGDPHLTGGQVHLNRVLRYPQQGGNGVLCSPWKVLEPGLGECRILLEFLVGAHRLPWTHLHQRVPFKEPCTLSRTALRHHHFAVIRHQDVALELVGQVVKLFLAPCIAHGSQQCICHIPTASASCPGYGRRRLECIAYLVGCIYKVVHCISLQVVFMKVGSARCCQKFSSLVPPVHPAAEQFCSL